MSETLSVDSTLKERVMNKVKYLSRLFYT